MESLLCPLPWRARSDHIGVRNCAATISAAARHLRVTRRFKSTRELSVTLPSKSTCKSIPIFPMPLGRVGYWNRAFSTRSVGAHRAALCHTLSPSSPQARKHPAVCTSSKPRLYIAGNQRQGSYVDCSWCQKCISVTSRSPGISTTPPKRKPKSLSFSSLSFSVWRLFSKSASTLLAAFRRQRIVAPS